MIPLYWLFKLCSIRSHGESSANKPDKNRYQDAKTKCWLVTRIPRIGSSPTSSVNKVSSLVQLPSSSTRCCVKLPLRVHNWWLLQVFIATPPESANWWQAVRSVAQIQAWWQSSLGGPYPLLASQHQQSSGILTRFIPCFVSCFVNSCPASYHQHFDPIYPVPFLCFMTISHEKSLHFPVFKFCGNQNISSCGKAGGGHGRMRSWECNFCRATASVETISPEFWLLGFIFGCVKIN